MSKYVDAAMVEAIRYELSKLGRIHDELGLFAAGMEASGNQGSMQIRDMQKRLAAVTDQIGDECQTLLISIKGERGVANTWKGARLEAEAAMEPWMQSFGGGRFRVPELEERFINEVVVPLIVRAAEHMKERAAVEVETGAPDDGNWDERLLWLRRAAACVRELSVEEE